MKKDQKDSNILLQQEIETWIVVIGKGKENEMCLYINNEVERETVGFKFFLS